MIRRILLLFLFAHISFTLLSQNWVKVGDGFNLYPTRMFVEPIENKLYITGNFDSTGTTPLPYCAVLDGNKWDSIRFLPYGYTASNIVSYQNKLYCSPGSGMLVSWSGVKLDTVGHFTYPTGNGQLPQLFVYDNELLAIGGFDSVNGISANDMAAWNGTQWRAFDTTNWIGSIGNDLVEFQDDLYMTGLMFKWDGSVKQLARWDGAEWKGFGGGIIGGFSGPGPTAVYNNELYIGGTFFTAGGNPGNCVARWDGTQWKDVSPGMTSNNAYTTALKVYNGYLYASGQFYSMGGYPISAIARWDGQQWCGLGQQFDPSWAAITCMEVYNDELYIGGNFISVDGDTVNCIAKWVGGNFSDMCTEPIGISETDISSLVTLHPNPASTTITLSGTEPGSTATITNLHGQVVSISEIQHSPSPISVAHLSPGMYFCIVQSGGQRKVLRFVRE